MRNLPAPTMPCLDGTRNNKGVRLASFPPLPRLGMSRHALPFLGQVEIRLSDTHLIPRSFSLLPAIFCLRSIVFRGDLERLGTLLTVHTVESI